MDLPPNETQAENDPQLPAARRRHAERSLFGPLNIDERSLALEETARRAAPNADFFLYSLFSGAVIGLGLLFDSPYLLLLGALIAPLMAPAIGIALGTALGSGKHFGRSFGALLISALLVLAAGWLAGLAAQSSNTQAIQAHLFAQISWPALIVLGVAGVLTSASFVQPGHNPELPSMLLAYGIFIPLATAGFGLGSGLPHLWPDGFVLFAIHLAWATLCGAVTLAVIGFRPPRWYGYSLGAAVLLAGILVFIGLTGAGAVFGAGIGLPTLTPSNTWTPSPTLTPSATATRTPTLTPSPSRTPTPSFTASPSPTPVLAVIHAEEGNGAIVREEPAGVAITTVLNGRVVQVLPEEPVSAGGQIWIHVSIPGRDLSGWILQNLLATVTPQP